MLGGTANGAVALVATVSPELTKKIQAGKIIQAIAPDRRRQGRGPPGQRPRRRQRGVQAGRGAGQGKGVAGVALTVFCRALGPRTD